MVKGEKEEAKRKEGEKKDEEDSDVHPNGKPESGTESISDDEAEDLGAKDDDDCIPESISNDDSMEVDGTEPVESGEREIPIVGLENGGNDCFFNAAFQCLAHTRLFAKRVLEKKEYIETQDFNWMRQVGDLIKPMLSISNGSMEGKMNELKAQISEAKEALMDNLPNI